MIYPETQLGELIFSLYEHQLIKFGDFTLKSGKTSNIYLDLRSLISYPETFNKAINLMKEKLFEIGADEKKSCLLAIPYSGLIFASHLQNNFKAPLFYKRKEQKEYGTKKLFEGIEVIKENSYTDLSIYIIEDVVTTGSSILETLEHLNSDLVSRIKGIICLVDRREESDNPLIFGRDDQEFSIPVYSLCTLREVVQYLIRFYSPSNFHNFKIDLSNRFMKYTKLDVSPIGKRLATCTLQKKTNLIFSADLLNMDHLLELAQKVSPYICAIKVHSDAILDFDFNKMMQLRQLADLNNFLIIEDRKFADIGSTTYKQLLCGINRWADLVTVHSLFGAGTLQGIIQANQEISSRQIGVFLLAESSSKDNLIDQNYVEKTIELAEEFQDLVVGFISQGQITSSRYLYATPGINLEKLGDKLSQSYKTPEQAVLAGTDLIIVGRGIYGDIDPVKAAKEYRDASWFKVHI